MGLYGQFNDVSSDSIPLLLLALTATVITRLRSFLLCLLKSVGLLRFGQANVDTTNNLLGSTLTEQLKINNLFSYKYFCNRDGGLIGSKDCVVCLSKVRDGDLVSELACRHVFHKDCFDAWLDHLNFTCPLCRSPLLVSDDLTRWRVGETIDY